MNVFTVAGRVVADAEQRFTASGTAVLGFKVATDVGFGDKKHALFISCSLWGKRGESLAPYITKGSPITVSGEADLREWESNGKSGTSLELNVNEVALQGGKSGGESKPAAQRPPAQAAPKQEAFDDDDIPF
jgi:single-strand DNA-binding protein